MSILVQELIVGAIVIAAIGWIIWRITHRKKNVSCCNCEDCPLANCSSRKNIENIRKKVGKKVAESDK
ncbi:MAG: FeoB-associated Cys-rich membrane protein [Bacteroidaceae bacterium]|nr:FeoB-associated Cys-rich membrane protein [Bacteroidaceae bacterium]